MKTRTPICTEEIGLKFVGGCSEWMLEKNGVSVILWCLIRMAVCVEPSARACINVAWIYVYAYVYRV